MRGKMEKRSQGRRQAREGNDLAEILERAQQASEDRHHLSGARQAPPNIFEVARLAPSRLPPANSHHLARAKDSRASQNTLRASAKPEVSPTPSAITRNRGAVKQPRCARHSMARTGPYDAIFDNYGRRSRNSVRRLEPLLPALLFLRRFRCRFLSTFSHLLPS